MPLFQSVLLLLTLTTSALRVPFLNQPVQAPTKLNFGAWSHSPTVKELDGVVVPVNRAVKARSLPSVSTTRIDPRDAPIGWASVIGDVYAPQNIELARPDEAQLLKRVALVSATLLVATALALSNLILGGAGVSAAQSLLKRVARLSAVVLVPRALPSL